MKCNLKKPMSESAFRKFQNERTDVKCIDCGVLLFTTSFHDTMMNYMVVGKKALDRVKNSRCEECHLKHAMGLTKIITDEIEGKNDRQGNGNN